MRVLVAGHSYVVGEGRRKLAHLATQPGIEAVGLIVPSGWRHASWGEYQVEPAAWDAPIQMFVSPIQRSGRVYAFSYDASVVLRALREFRPDVIQVEQEPGSLALAQFVALAGLVRGVKLTAFTWENLYFRQPGLRRILETLSLRRLDALLAGSTGAADVFRKKGYNGPIHVMPNIGVDADLFSPRRNRALRQELGIDEHFVVGYVGRLVSEKGCADLLRAFSGLDAHCRLLLVGGGDMRDELGAMADELGVADRVIFQPTVPHDVVGEYMNAMDCMVLPSRTVAGGWREQFGLVLAQAMACGVPVIGSDSGAIPEVMGEAGLVFAEGDSAALQACIQRLITEPERHAYMGQMGRQRVVETYTHEQLAIQTADVLRQVVGRAAGRGEQAPAETRSGHKIVIGVLNGLIVAWLLFVFVSHYAGYYGPRVARIWQSWGDR